MKVIRANCRAQFTANDFEFIVSVLGRAANQQVALVELLSDEACRDAVLDDPKIHQTLIEDCRSLKISPHLYFYVLVRQAFLRVGIQDRDVADYVAEVLCAFSDPEAIRVMVPHRKEPLNYFFEMLEALQYADGRTEFCLRVHMGNHSLFLTGLFAERIRHRAERKGFPGMSYYEQWGRSSFEVASGSRLAREYAVDEILPAVASRFSLIRSGLNDLSSRILFLGDGDTESRFAGHFA